MTRFSDLPCPAYHLRPNKAIDRLLFVEFLRTYSRWRSKIPSTYIGLGGAFLEDFRLMSQEFPELSLVCIERDAETKKRQIFHKCSSRMRFYLGTYSEYLATQFPTHKPVVVWADYTQMTRECLSEVSGTVRKAVEGSMIRFTVKAESPAFGTLGIKARKFPERMPVEKEKAFAEFRDSFRSRMAVDRVVFPNEWFEWQSFSIEGYPRLLSRMLTAVANGACSAPKRILPLHAAMYSDGTIMMSWTALVCHDADFSPLHEHFRRTCEYYSLAESGIALIDVPILTTKERLAIAKLLPTKNVDGVRTAKSLGYLLDGEASDTETKHKLEQYELYFRLYPHFGKIVP